MAETCGTHYSIYNIFSQTRVHLYVLVTVSKSYRLIQQPKLDKGVVGMPQTLASNELYNTLLKQGLIVVKSACVNNVLIPLILATTYKTYELC